MKKVRPKHIFKKTLRFSKYSLLTIIIILSSFLSVSFLSMKIDQNQLVSLEPHNSIFIDGNAALISFPNKTGSGNLTHPYIIQDLEINATGVFEAIEIRNTDKPLIILNCTLKTDSIALAGLLLHNVTNVSIINCTITDNEDGIFVNDSQSVTIWDNDITNNNDRGIYAANSTLLNITRNYFFTNFNNHIETSYSNSTTITHNFFRTNSQRGLWIRYSPSTYIYNNTLSDSPDEISVSGSDYTKVINNTIYDGSFTARGVLISSAAHCIVQGNNVTQHMTTIHLYYADNATVRDNTVEDGGFRIDGMNYYSVVENNTQDGKPIYYYRDKNGLSSENFTNAAQIFLYNCSNSMISDLNISRTYTGIKIYAGQNNTILHNTIFSNSQDGIEVISSDFNKIINNTIFDITRLVSCAGISLGGSADNTTLMGNHIYDTSIGVNLYWSDNITITANNISDNGQYNIYMDNADMTTIIGNNISFARVFNGIQLDNADENVITQNNLSYNNDYGIYVETTSANNLIYLNTFIGNNHPEAWYMASGSGNAFDNGSLGNYYSDYRYYHPVAGYTGAVWDNSYEINIIFDYYPLVSPYGLNWSAPPPSNPYGCINIDGNGALEAFPNKTGLGTFVSPYIIKDLVIDAYETTSPITIRNTNKPLIIRNCTLSNSSAVKAGLFLHNVSYITVNNCTLFDNQDGIFVNASQNCTFWDNDITNNNDRGIYAAYSTLLNITRNYFFTNFDNHIETSYSNSTTITHNFFRTNSQRGLWIRYSPSTYIYNNTLSDSPDEISVSGSDYTKVINNTIYDGGSFTARGVLISSAAHCIVQGNNVTQHMTTIHLYYADNATVRDNTVEDGGFRIDGMNYYSVVENNTQDGKPIYYYRDKNGLSSENFTNAAQIFLYNCSNSMISDLNISRTYTGIKIYAGQNNTILHNTISSNSQDGIEIISSDFNKIINNTVFDITRLVSCAGISLGGSADNTTLMGNHVYDTSIGVNLYWSDNITITANNISDNGQYNIYMDNSDMTTIIGNNISFARTYHGIYLDDSDQNLIAANNISFNDDNGVYVATTSAENLIYLNTFIGNNYPQARYFATGSGNAFHNGSLGNFYGDYRLYHPTAGHDGAVWNESYQIDSLYDNYPLVSPWGLNWTAQPPTLASIIPNPSKNGIINLAWSCTGNVTLFYIYRNTSLINSVSGLTPITSVTTYNYTDNITTNGVYYYVIISENDLGKSSISNCESVTVYIMPAVEILSPGNGNQFQEAQTIPLVVNVTDFFTITQVQLYVNSTYIDNLTYNGSLYLYDWMTSLGLSGIKLLEIRAYNVLGIVNDTETVWVNITLYIPPPEHADVYNVTTTNSTGYPQDNFTRGEQVIYEVTIRGDLGSGSYVVMAHTDDPTLNAYLTYNETVQVQAGLDTIVKFYFNIPTGTSVPTGTYKVYLTVWTDWPYNRGICIDYIIESFTVN